MTMYVTSRHHLSANTYAIKIGDFYVHMADDPETVERFLRMYRRAGNRHVVMLSFDRSLKHTCVYAARANKRLRAKGIVQQPIKPINMFKLINKRKG